MQQSIKDSFQPKPAENGTGTKRKAQTDSDTKSEKKSKKGSAKGATKKPAQHTCFKRTWFNAVVDGNNVERNWLLYEGRKLAPSTAKQIDLHLAAAVGFLHERNLPVLCRTMVLSGWRWMTVSTTVW
jgi:hypothetical protein